MASLNSTPSGERIKIGFFGLRNVGKSSLVNRVTNQSVSLVSDVKGTTTDPVKKAMELLPLGAVLIVDTPGIDDVGELGEMRVKKTREMLKSTDIAVIVREAGKEESELEAELLKSVREMNIPYLIVFNKADEVSEKGDENTVYVSAKTGEGIEELKNRIAALAPKENDKKLVSDKIEKGDIVILVTPIDEAAPKGRLILPQQATIRDIIDSGASALVCQPSELSGVLDNLKKAPKMVITDSQAFKEVEKIVPRELPLTSFSIIFARYKGELEALSKGAEAIKKLKTGDKVLIAEGCTHKRQCGDIGSVKIPNLIKKFTGAEPQFSFTSGGEFPENLQEYKLVIHCGGCMLSEREMQNRLSASVLEGVPMVNFGVAIAFMNGILERSLEIFEA